MAGKVENRYSDNYWYLARVYRYDYKDGYVQWIENSDENPYMYEVVDEIGLSRENWENQESRDEYLSEWNGEQEAEIEAMMPYLAEEFGF